MNNLENTQTLNFPEIKNYIERIINFVNNNIIKKYRNNENILRINYNDEEKLKKEKQIYFKELKLFDDYIINKIYKEQYLFQFINNNSKEKEIFYNKILYDYYEIFINNIFKKNNNSKQKVEKPLILDIENIKKLLALIVDLKNTNIKKYLIEENNDIIIKFVSTINWIQSYSKEIKLILDIFLKLNLKIPELYNLLKIIINERQIKYEIEKRKKENISIVNETFFILINSFLRILNIKYEIYELYKDDLFTLINIIKVIIQNVLRLENNLNLYSKEVITLKEIINLMEAFYDIGKIKIENIKKIINYFSNEIQYINNSNKLCDNLNNFYNFLIEELSIENINNDKLYKSLSYLFLIEYKKIYNTDFREFILRKILENNNLIKNCSQIFIIIFENIIDNSPVYMINNLDNIKKEKSNILKIINNSKNIFLDEIIMNILEGKIMIYFETIKQLNREILEELYPKYFNDSQNIISNNERGIIFDNSINIFKQTLQFLDEIIIKNNNDINNINICKLYSIVYIKMYLNKFVFLIKNKYNDLDDYKEVMNTIHDIKNKSFEKIIKIYILKLLYNFLDNNLEFLNNLDYKKYNIDTKDFKSLFNEKEEIFLTYFLLPIDKVNYNIYLNELKKFEIIRNKNFIYNDNEKENLTEIDDIDDYLTISINKFISNFNYIFDKEKYLNFSSFSKNLLNKKYNNNPELIKLLYLYYDYDTFQETILPNYINNSLFEILLYGFRFCVQTLENNNIKEEKYLFQSLLKKENIEEINKSLIPGIDMQEDLHLITLETITNHLNTKVDRHGCYVCSCGYYYDIDPCGFPTKNRTFKCPVCELKIGWGPKKIKKGEETHGMVIRPGHYRIFKDQKQKIGQMKVFDEVDENIPNLLLEDYIKQVIDPIRKKSFFGFNAVLKNYFKNKNKNVRNLSEIGYRLLNFISYCHLFFCYCMKNISKENMNKNLIQNMTILEIIEDDWNLLKDSLEQKNISSIQIFMNLIFKELSNLIKSCKFLAKEEDRKGFEDEVEKIIDKCIKEYQDFSYKYIDENKKQLNIVNYYSLESIITELFPPNEQIYSEKDFPFLKYFLFSKYKTKNDFMNHLINKERYPLINQILLNKPEHKKMKYLPIFNQFTNLMVENYSFKISRDDAKCRILCNEEIYKNPEFIQIYKKFINIWNELKNNAIKYKCHPEMEIKELNSDDKLIYFLNDNGELGNGMYITAACQNFIEWQNSFLQPIADSYELGGILNCYIDIINKKIPLQEAKSHQILSIEESFEKSKYKSFNDIIYSFSQRNIYEKEGKVNYSNYNIFIYDYDLIEEELGKIILPGLCLFEDEDKLNFIKFWSEGFRNGRSEIISNFYLKYPQKDLKEEEKLIVINYIKKMNKENLRKNNVKYDFKEFYGSIQMYIFYLVENGIIKDDEKIINALKNSSIYFKISNDCKNFFLEEGNQLSVDKIMNLFFYFEHLCYEELIKNLQNEYKKEISNDTKINIINKLIKNKTERFPLYNIKDLGAAVRRFISRYLVGKLQINDIKEDRDLAFELSREDLWEKKISESEGLNNAIKEQISIFKLNVDQAYAFYELIGEEDKRSIDIFL